MRKLATVRKIDRIEPIDGADAIECAIVGGWSVVVKKGDFVAGELAMYLEIDSWVPTELAPFLSKGHEPRVYNGVKGERLRSIKLRGKISQGLLLPLGTEDNAALVCCGITFPCIENYDATEDLGIQKWEAPIPAQLAGDVEGPFPSQIPKTDQERVQNLAETLLIWQNNQDFTWEATEKLDGSSMTVFVMGDKEGVCSRNWSLKETEGNTLWSVARREQLIEKIRSTGRNLALQGELVGEGIQKNQYNLRGQDFYLYDIYDIDRDEYLSPIERSALVNQLGIMHVPVLTYNMIVPDMQGVLAFAEDKSKINPKTEREGVVFKCNTHGGPTFKAISNRWLLKNGE